MREVMQQINLKPNEAEYKSSIIMAADRLNVAAANAFLKTLEEPPPKSVLILATTDPSKMLETIVSRCLRLNFWGEGKRGWVPEQMEWITAFSEMAAVPQKSLLGRYRLMDVLLKKLNQLKEKIDEILTARSPLQQHSDVEKDLAEKWEEELKAAIEAEYRRQRADLLLVLQWWLRDIWLHVTAKDQSANGSREGGDASQRLSGDIGDLLMFPALVGCKQIAQRLSPREALENLRIMEQLQRWLGTNVQEALALEVGLLKLHL